MLAHTDVWSAIDSLAERNGLSPSGLARRAGLDPTTFNKSKRHAPDGRPRWPSTESISKILSATNTNINELFAAQGGPSRSGEAISVPLIGDAHAGFDVTARRDVTRLPHPPRIISFPDKRHEPLYALTVVGDSMKPLYRDGDVLFISTSAKPGPGDRVVVKLMDEDLVVRVMKEQTSRTVCFHAVNPDHPDIALEPSSIEWIAKIVYASQ